MTVESTLLRQQLQHDETSLRYMLKLAGPMVVSTVSMTIMQFVDRFMVSRLGTDALAAVLPAAFVSFVPAGFAMGTMTSLNTFVSQSLGRGNNRGCSDYFWQTVYAGLAYSILVAVLLWPLAPIIFKAMQHPASVIGMEVIYFRIMLFAGVAAVVNWSSNNFFMGIHRPIVTMYASLVGQGVNIFVNYLLIFGKFGFPRMGIAGAAWGTCLGMSVAATINMAAFLSRRIDASFASRRTLRIDYHKMYDLLKVGIPAGLSLMVNVALWGVVLLALVGRFGKEALAATSAALSYTNLSVMPIVGMSTALTAAVGKAIGAGKKEIVMRQTHHCLRVAVLSMGLLGICFFLFRRPLMLLWSTDEKVIHIGSGILVCAAVYQIFHATRVVYAGSLQGAGDTVWLAIISAIGGVGVLGLGGLAAITLIPSLGAIGPWTAATLSIMVVGLANRWRFKSNRWMKIDLFRRGVGGVPIHIGADIE
jgi:MATE family multidrug resistance protein